MFRNTDKLALAMILVLVAQVAAAAEIHLRDGKIIQIKTFWEKNDKIMFEKYGSIVGVGTEIVKEVRSNQEETAYRQFNQSWRDSLSGMEFVWIPSGCFYMSDRVSGLEKETCLDGFWMGSFEVKNSQFRRFEPGHNQESFYQDYYLGDKDQPAVNVSGEQARKFADWMTEVNKGNFKFRLPTEAEWEYASRGGSDKVVYSGTNADQACYHGNFKDTAWQDANRSEAFVEETCFDGFVATAPVGSFQPNSYGLYDMVGNASEWCIEEAVARGSSFINFPNRSLAEQRFPGSLSSNNYWTGFRLVMQRKQKGGFAMFSALNEYGGQTKRLVDYKNDENYEKGVWQILYFFDADGDLAKKDVNFNNTYASLKGISKKVFYTHKHEVYYTAKVAAEIGYNKITMYREFDFKRFLKKLKLVDS
jgi:formylglycine-generating enzyme required for sulfatase activity